MITFHDISTADLKQMIYLKEQIEALQEKLSNLRGVPTTKRKVGRPAGTKRTMSADTRQKMALAQQARWAKIKSPADKPKARKEGTITPEGRAKLAVVMKARWAARKKGAPALNAPTKSGK